MLRSVRDVHHARRETDTPSSMGRVVDDERPGDAFSGGGSADAALPRIEDVCAHGLLRRIGVARLDGGEDPRAVELRRAGCAG